MKKMNKIEVIIKIASFLIILGLIIILSIYITNRKQAVYVATETQNENTYLNTSNENENNDNSSWQIVTNADATKNENTAKQNTIANENKVIQNTTTTENVTIPNTKATENVTTPNTKATENTTTQNTNATENTTKQNSAKNETNKKESDDRAGVIYLSFDDGPSSNITPKVLDILKEQKIKATFFVINYSDSNAHLVKREAEEGHTIGIHGYSHKYAEIYKSKEAFLDNVYSLQDKIEKTTGIKSTYVRFPGGSSNTISRKYCKGIMTELAKELLAKGFKYYDWNVCAEDAGSAKSSKDVYNYVTKNLKKDRQNMVLMHDFSGNKKGLDALEDIIEYGKKNGYTFMAVDDKTPMFAQHINN